MSYADMREDAATALHDVDQDDAQEVLEWLDGNRYEADSADYLGELLTAAEAAMPHINRGDIDEVLDWVDECRSNDA